MTEKNARKLLDDLLNRHSPWRIVTDYTEIAERLRPACLRMLSDNPIQGLEDFEDGNEGLVHCTLIDE